MILISLMLSIFVSSNTTFANFSDVNETTNYYTAINWMAENNIIHGYSDDTFKPERCVNRAEFLKMLYLTSQKNINNNETQADYSNTFTDTSTNEWYWPYVKQALNDKTIKGYADGTFKPNQYVNRVEAIKMAVLEFNIYDETADEYGYSDANPRDIDLNAWYASYFWSAQTLHALGLNHVTVTGEGIPENYFYPGEPMTRKEVAEMLYSMKVIKDTTDENTTQKTFTGDNFTFTYPSKYTADNKKLWTQDRYLRHINQPFPCDVYHIPEIGIATIITNNTIDQQIIKDFNIPETALTETSENPDVQYKQMKIGDNDFTTVTIRDMIETTRYYTKYNDQIISFTIHPELSTNIDLMEIISTLQFN